MRFVVINRVKCIQREGGIFRFLRYVRYRVLVDIKKCRMFFWLEVINGLVKLVYKLFYYQFLDRILEISIFLKFKRYKSDGFNIVLFSLFRWFV